MSEMDYVPFMREAIALAEQGRWHTCPNPTVGAVLVRDGQIVLNIGPSATNKLQMGNEYIDFQARFGGVARQLSVPIDCISAIYARENGAGMAFELEVESSGEEAMDALAADAMPEDEAPPEPPRPEGGRPKLQRIK